MAESDRVQPAEGYDKLRLLLVAMREQVEQEHWEEAEALFAQLLPSMQALPIIDWSQYSAAQQQELAELLRATKQDIDDLLPAMQAWRGELATILQGFTNQQRLQRTYGQ